MIVRPMRLRYLPIMLFLVAALGFGDSAFAQIQIGDDLSEIDYARPKKYEIGGVVVDGAKYVDGSMLSMIANLRVGETISIPGDEISNGIRKIWEQGLFEDVAINATDFVGDKVFLQIIIKEKPRVSKFSFKGIKKSEADDIRNKINLSRGDIATEHLLTKTTRIIEDFYFEKGFLNVDIDIKQIPDTLRENYVDMVININKGEKVKIGKINVIGNENLSEGQILTAMKETKQRGHFDPLGSYRTVVCEHHCRYFHPASHESHQRRGRIFLRQLPPSYFEGFEIY